MFLKGRNGRERGASPHPFPRLFCRMPAICKFHMGDGCKNPACTFAHPTPKPAVCKYFVVGNCRYGDECRDYHATKAKTKSTGKPTNDGTKDGKKDVTGGKCKFAGSGSSHGGIDACTVLAPTTRAGGSASTRSVVAKAGLAGDGIGKALLAAGGSSRVFVTTMTTTTTISRSVVSAVACKAPPPPAKSARKPVDVVLSFDTTGSMYSYLDSVRAALGGLISDLSAKAARHGVSLRMGVIAHGDYCDKASTYVIKYLPLLDVSDPAASAKLSAFVAGVEQTGGGDAPECYELALQKALTEMGWAPASARVMVIVGDDLPHEPGYSCNGFTNALDWRITLSKLAAAQVRIFSVQAGSNARADPFWNRLAEETQGKRLPVKSIATIKDLVLAASVREMGDAAYDEVGKELRAKGCSREVEIVYESIRTVRVRHASASAVIGA